MGGGGGERKSKELGKTRNVDEVEEVPIVWVTAGVNVDVKVITRPFRDCYSELRLWCMCTNMVGQ